MSTSGAWGKGNTLNLSNNCDMLSYQFNNNVTYWFGISASVQTHKRLYDGNKIVVHSVKWLKIQTIPLQLTFHTVLYALLCGTVVLWVLPLIFSHSVEVSDNLELPHVTLFISFQCASWLFSALPGMGASSLSVAFDLAANRSRSLHTKGRKTAKWKVLLFKLGL